MAVRTWTRDELILAFELYCHTPFSKISSKDEATVALAERLDRTPSAVAFKLANFARLDPALISRGISGLSNGSKGEKQIWQEFHDDWTKLGEEAHLVNQNFSPGKHPESSRDTSGGGDAKIVVDFSGDDVLGSQKVRRGQAFFRKAVMTSYSFRCCLSGYSIPELLVASHIVPWSIDEKNRRNPANGLCLNSVLDKLFDRGLMTITTDYICSFSIVFEETASKLEAMELLKYSGRKMRLPERFLPNKDFLLYHNEVVFKK